MPIAIVDKDNNQYCQSEQDDRQDRTRQKDEVKKIVRFIIVKPCSSHNSPHGRVTQNHFLLRARKKLNASVFVSLLMWMTKNCWCIC